MKAYNKYLWWATFLIPIVYSVIVYSIGFNNEFVRWDDYKYIVENENLKNITWSKLGANTVGNYHPLTNYVLSVLLKKNGLNPHGYHVFQLFIHCMNILVLFKIITAIKEHKTISDFILTTVLLIAFSIHPFKVEDVSWISEIKDVGYSFFYLLAVYLYIRQLKEGSSKFNVLIIIIYLISLMFKSMAITLPILLFAIHKIYDLKYSFKTNKLFWVACAIIGVYFAYLATQTQEESTYEMTLELFERPLVTLYSLGFYIINFITPYQISIIYPFPATWKTSENIILVSIGIMYCSLIGYLLYKKNMKHFYISILFLIISLPIIQILPFGRSIVSERYTYLSYGCLVVLLAVAKFKSQKVVNYISCLGIVILAFNSTRTYARIKTWQNTMTLFHDLKYKYPNYHYAYFNIGEDYLIQNKLDSAQKYFLLTEFYYKKLTISDRYNKKWKESIYTSLGQSFAKAENMKIAKMYFLKAYGTGENRKNAINNMCGVYMIENKRDSCLYYYDELRNNYHEGLQHIDQYLNDPLYK